MTQIYCKICNSNSSLFSKAKILDRYNIQYFICPNCGFIQTEEPYWLEEAYSKAMTDTDLGILSRNINISLKVYYLIKSLFNDKASFLDYGCGYGIFVRLMRDRGLDFFGFDKYCQNIFSRDFQLEKNQHRHFELITTFEVFEHFEDPLREIEEMISYSKNILFTVDLIPPDKPSPQKWWFFGLDHGQHISFYSLKSLYCIAEKFNLNLYSDGSGLHILTERKLRFNLFLAMNKMKIFKLLDILFTHKTLLTTDFQNKPKPGKSDN